MALKLPTLAEVNATPHAPQKGLPSFLVKQDKKADLAAKEKGFIDAVWRRDNSKSRASGRKLSWNAKGWDQRGQVHHVLKRSTSPETKHDPRVGILLSKTEHALAETRCPGAIEYFMLDIVATVKGSEDRGLPQLFIWRDRDGVEQKRRIG